MQIRASQAADSTNRTCRSVSIRTATWLGAMAWLGTVVGNGLAAVPRPAAEYEVKVETNVPFKMRDGVLLATDIYRPTKDGQPLAGPLPAVLQRTPYNKAGFAPMAKFFASHGYLSVVQDCRGRFASEGKFVPFVQEPQDGYDTIELLAAHPGCNGRVGMYGCSYMAWVQFEAATQAPPHLVTMIPYEGPTNAYHYSQRVGGALHLGLLKWFLDVAPQSHENVGGAQRKLVAEMGSGQNFLEWAERIPWKRGETPLAGFPDYEDAAFKMYFENYDYNDFWRQPGLGMSEYFEKFPDMPILWVTGWFDWYPRTISDGYQRMVQLHRAHQHLLVGPWTHNNFSSSPGDVNFGDVDAPVKNYDDYFFLELAWFDRWLRQDANVDVGRPVQVFVMGSAGSNRAGGRLNHGGQWHFGLVWPPTDVQEARYYLQSGRKLAAAAPEIDSASTAYTYDPQHTVSSNGRCIIAYGPAAGLGFSGMGPRDQIELATLPGHGKPGTPLADRADVLSFRTDPLTQDVRIAGNIKVSLWVSSDAPDTDFIVKLIDQYPPAIDGTAGYAFPASEGILRARYRNGLDKPELLKPGEAYQLEIPLEPSANLFAAGHRIRLDVMSSNFPNYDINRNTGDPGSHELRIARNMIYHDREHPSAIVLPICPAASSAQ